MTYALRVAHADFVRDERVLVPGFTLTLCAGDDAILEASDAHTATIVARLCAAIVKPSHGTIYVGDFETRLQPPQAKRLVGYVDAAGFVGDDHALRCEIRFRADVWNLDHAAAAARARDVLAVIGNTIDPPYARAIALALVADVRLVVLDQPPSRAAERVRPLVPTAGIVSVRVASELRVREATSLAASH